MPFVSYSVLENSSPAELYKFKPRYNVPSIALFSVYGHKVRRIYSGAISAMTYMCVYDVYIYIYAPHNDVSVKDGPHIRRWSHNITILTIVLQLPTVFSTVT